MTLLEILVHVCAHTARPVKVNHHQVQTPDLGQIVCVRGKFPPRPPVDKPLEGSSRTFAGIDFFFCCIAELAIKPCRSSRSKLRGEFGIPNTCKTGNKNTTKQQTPPNPKHNTTQKKNGKCLECETRGEKRVKRPKRPNALICRTPGGSMRYPLSSSLGIMLISHSIVSIPASPSWFAI